jgi:UDP-N-acetylmuramyl pentapeptide synthase
VVEVPDAASALEVVRERVALDDAVLVKGSRAIGLDAVVRALAEPEGTP